MNGYVKEAKRVLEMEAQAIGEIARKLNKDFDRAVELLSSCGGRVVLTGMGKAGIIAQKISATLSSTGTPSLFLHSAEAIHGDLGRVTKEDVIVAISNSGEIEELKKMLPLIKKMGVKLISLTGNLKSTLARYSDIVLDIGVKKEACPLGLAPTCSTTAMLAMGDALSVCLIHKKKFKEENFAFYHPGGALGKKLLLKVEDIMRSGRSNPVVRDDCLVKDVLWAITNARAGAASVVDKKGKLAGIFTDGDLRRHLDVHPVRNRLTRKAVISNGVKINIFTLKIKDLMTKNPKSVSKEQLAVEALRVLEEKKIDELPVVDKNNRPIGMLDVQDILRAGLV